MLKLENTIRINLLALLFFFFTYNIYAESCSWVLQYGTHDVVNNSEFWNNDSKNRVGPS